MLKQNANEGCNNCATVVQVLQDLFLRFIACFILLVIAPLSTPLAVLEKKAEYDEGHNCFKSRLLFERQCSFVSIYIERRSCPQTTGRCWHTAWTWNAPDVDDRRAGATENTPTRRRPWKRTVGSRPRRKMAPRSADRDSWRPRRPRR